MIATVCSFGFVCQHVLQGWLYLILKIIPFCGWFYYCADFTDKEAVLRGVFPCSLRAVIHIAGIQSLDFGPELLTAPLYWAYKWSWIRTDALLRKGRCSDVFCCTVGFNFQLCTPVLIKIEVKIYNDSSGTFLSTTSFNPYLSLSGG